jgi:hypothetical protein
MNTEPPNDPNDDLSAAVVRAAERVADVWEQTEDSPGEALDALCVAVEAYRSERAAGVSDEQ